MVMPSYEPRPGERQRADGTYQHQPEQARPHQTCKKPGRKANK